MGSSVNTLDIVRASELEDPVRRWEAPGHEGPRIADITEHLDARCL